MKLKLVAMLLLAACVFAACGEDPAKEKRQRRTGNLLTPASSGNPYEVMVVADDSVWTGYAGRALQTILDKPLRGLPQDEPQFHKSHVEKAHYNRITNLFRNIVRINIGNEFTQAKMKVEKGGRAADYDYNARKKQQNEEIDRILDKLKKSGYSSLTTEEKKRLFNASQR